MLDLAREMLELCPDALLLNYTNPMSILTWSEYKAYPDVRVVGLCPNGPYTIREIASYIGVRHEELVYEGAGINHIVCLTRLEDRFFRHSLKISDTLRPAAWSSQVSAGGGRRLYS